jgi:hypothetical protein
MCSGLPAAARCGVRRRGATASPRRRCAAPNVATAKPLSCLDVLGRAVVGAVETTKTQGTYVDPALGRQKFERFVLDDWAPAQDWKETTRESWPYVWALLQPLLGGYPLWGIDQLTLKSVRAELAKSYAHNTVKLTMAYAKMILRAAYTSGRIGRDPTVGLKGPKARADDPSGQVRPEDVPTRDEALAILTVAPAAFRAAIALVRLGLEASACRRSDVREVQGSGAAQAERRRQVLVPAARVQVPCLPPLVRLDPARRGRPAHGGCRPSGRHRRDGRPDLRALVARRP